MPMNTALGDLPPSAAHAHTGAWVASVLRSRIAEGRLVPGTKLSEQSLSETLGISRNTLREAFTVLDGELIITRIPNRGVFVASPGPDEIREIYNVRRILEPAAALWGPGPDLDELRSVVADARDALARGSVPEMAAANQRFHEALILGTGSTGLLETMQRVLAQMRLVFHAMSNAPDFHSHYVELNAELLELLAAGKRAEAAERMRGYLDKAEAELLAQFTAAH
ncbi:MULTISPECIES: GntR family transcriptional regulator [unclassified Arthrobacter]|uniref:GntR family transcriptional regulator n=1 Tax=unclassified Arthrobacter TaxID=235627 RepID=UPI00159E37A0|nr:MULTISPECIES: GntR family transcriptional regulator [unclassified Arthrobacter]MCQ9164858.1 GntR family transcriptional regulator [Arthrobacter sp. STN4]NVN00310.1 GntR family transcriptional regulator [Arthrobacter sp. SDTb3-6]